VVRKLLLAASTNSWLRERAMKAPFVMRSVSRFMPGERAEDALAAAKQLQQEGIGTILTQLGENLTTAADAAAVRDHYVGVLERVSADGLDAHISVKLTQLGLDLDRESCRRNLERLVDCGRDLRRFVWIDMESARYVDATLDLFRAMRERSHLVGVALQAYLIRTERDVESLLPLGSALRLVKGAYLEPRALVYPRKSDVDENYFRLAVRILEQHSRAGGGDEGLLHIATHDRRLIERLAAHIDSQGVPRSFYEYAMLYGIQTSLQRRLAGEGKRVRVLISYGAHWFPWYVRRLAERPANLWFVVKQIGK
jgi:proline dehydrogenase